MRRLLTAAALLAAAATACDTVPIDEADASPPTVQVNLRQPDGSYQPVATATLTNQQLEFMATVDDAQGVKSLRLEFAGASSKHCTVGGSVFDGTFPLTLPKPIEQELQGNDKGEVLTRFPLFATLPADVSCTVNGKKGRPYGHTITARAIGRNWGDGAAVVDELKVTVS